MGETYQKMTWDELAKENTALKQELDKAKRIIKENVCYICKKMYADNTCVALKREGNCNLDKALAELDKEV